MSGDVKSRRYDSSRRLEQAEQTRERVLAAATELFIERGYQGASIAGIAERAGVSAETIYQRFGNKRTLLGACVQHAVRGGERAPVPEQAGPRKLAALADQHEQLWLFAADIVERLERAAPLLGVAAEAARSERELQQLVTAAHDHRLANLRTLIDALERNGPLRLPAAQATETVWALTSPELHQLLIRERRWSRRRYQTWLADSLATLLLVVSAKPTADDSRSPDTA